MHTLRIDKNFFSDEEHLFPEHTVFQSMEEAKSRAEYYQEELQKISGDAFTVCWITVGDDIYLNLKPLKQPLSTIHKELCFSIKNGSALQEFWDYFINEHYEFRLHGCLENIIYMFYGIAAFRIRRSLPSTIKIQELNHAYRLSIGGVTGFPVECVRRLINPKHGYKELVEEDEFTFFVPKNRYAASSEIFVPLKGESKTIRFQDFNDETLQLFSFLEDYELDELIELMQEFNSIVLLLGSSSLDEEEAMELVQKLRSMGKILISSHESYNLGIHIDNMSREIEENFGRFVELGPGMAELCNAFNHDLTTWVKKLFFEGASSLHFMDDSLASNCLTICKLLHPDPEEEGCSLDDIFDF